MFTARSFAKNAQDFASGLPTYPSKKLRVGFTPAGRLNWCTGKDSNLRTSLGGTDLQSVGFNHSPTCAKTPKPSASLLHFPASFTGAAHARGGVSCSRRCPN